MAIRRLTIDLDDSQDIAGSTTLPLSLLPQKDLIARGKSTSTPKDQEDYLKQESSKQDQGILRTSETIGRTPSDLFFTFVNRPEFIATALTGLSFFIFRTKLQQVKDFWLPIGVSAILNFVWFGLVLIKKIPWFRGAMTK